MEISPRLARQTLLLSMVLVIVPMVVFPEQLGTSLVKASLITALYELVFYSALLYVLNRQAALIQLVQAGAVCLVYRLTLGAMFGLMIAVMYSMNISVSLTLGMSGYLPTIILQILAAPLVLQPLLREMIFPPVRRAKAPSFSETVVTGHEPDTGSLDALSSDPRSAARVATTPFYGGNLRETTQSQTDPAGHGGDGFDRVARYIGEDGAVELAVVVDREGLILGCFKRGTIDAEAWAPLAGLLHQQNSAVLLRSGWSRPERLDMVLPEHKLTIAYDRHYALMVVAERQMNDTLGIRVNQGLEMIRQHIAQRYSQSLFDNVERSHVRSA
ncbi:MAG: hypothetical protein ABIE70_03640 [bacterium]